MRKLILLTLALSIGGGVLADATYKLVGKTYSTARGVTICNYRKPGDFSSKGKKVKELNGRVSCPGVYIWGAQAETAPESEGAYMLEARSYNSSLGKTICTYRRAGGGGHKVKELNGNVQCPGVFF